MSKNQNMLILEHYFNKGRTINPIEAREKPVQSTRLAARIHELKESGHNIGKIMVTLDNCRTAIAQYHLIK